MQMRNVSFELLSFVGAVFMAACGVTEITVYMRTNRDFGASVICVGTFWCIAAILLLISLRLGNHRNNLNKDGVKNEHPTQPPVLREKTSKMQFIPWAVRLGVICLVVAIGLQVLGRHTPYSNSILSSLVAFANTKVVALSLAMWIGLPGMLLLMLVSVRFALRCRANGRRGRNG